MVWWDIVKIYMWRLLQIGNETYQEFSTHETWELPLKYQTKDQNLALLSSRRLLAKSAIRSSYSFRSLCYSAKRISFWDRRLSWEMERAEGREMDSSADSSIFQVLIATNSRPVHFTITVARSHGVVTMCRCTKLLIRRSAMLANGGSGGGLRRRHLRVLTATPFLGLHVRYLSAKKWDILGARTEIAPKPIDFWPLFPHYNMNRCERFEVQARSSAVHYGL